MILKNEETEFRIGAKEMWAEGKCDFKPTERDIVNHMSNNGYKADNIDVFYDLQMECWQWNCDIKKIKQ